MNDDYCNTCPTNSKGSITNCLATTCAQRDLMVAENWLLGRLITEHHRIVVSIKRGNQIIEENRLRREAYEKAPVAWMGLTLTQSVIDDLERMIKARLMESVLKTLQQHDVPAEQAQKIYDQRKLETDLPVPDHFTFSNGFILGKEKTAKMFALINQRRLMMAAKIAIDTYVENHPDADHAGLVRMFLDDIKMAAPI